MKEIFILLSLLGPVSAITAMEVEVETIEDLNEQLLVEVTKPNSYNKVLDLLERGAQVTTKNGDNLTPLHLAALGGYLDVCKLLIEKGADVNAQGKYNMTPLHIAAEKGHLDVCKFLIEKGADVNAQSKDNMTPLHLAVYYDHLDLCIVLIEKGADVNAKDQYNVNPLYYANLNNHLEIEELIESTLEFACGICCESLDCFLAPCCEQEICRKCWDKWDPSKKGCPFCREKIHISQCEICSKTENLKRCTVCKKVRYCSVACQRKDWSSHKKECKKD